MELYEAIRKRYSVRSYEAKDVEDEKLRRVLDAGRTAPSARNRQEWKFVVVRDPAVRAKLAAAAEQEWIQAAPVIIAVVGLTDGQTMFCDVPKDPVDCAIAIDHMTLAAVAEGLGTCWIGHFKQDEAKKILGVPEGAKIIELLPLGYPKGPAKADKPRKSFDEVVCWETFS
ncbi:MAG: nitroreductase family protein [Phycisphaerae bacterium]|nr:nitroreductase family protein [Phycisphaerae bacterium]